MPTWPVPALGTICLPSHRSPPRVRTRRAASHGPFYVLPAHRKSVRDHFFADASHGGYVSAETHLVHPTEDRPEAGCERVALLGEEGVSGLGTLEAELGVRQRHPRREDVLSRTSSRHDCRSKTDKPEKYGCEEDATGGGTESMVYRKGNGSARGADGPRHDGISLRYSSCVYQRSRCQRVSIW